MSEKGGGKNPAMVPNVLLGDAVTPCNTILVDCKINSMVTKYQNTG